MDFVYFVGPALTTFLFAYLALGTDPQKRPIMRLMFLLCSLCALLVFNNTAQIAALYGETVPDTTITTYNYAECGPICTTNNTLMNTTAVTNYTHISPMVSSNYDNLWLIVIAVVWMIGIYLFVMLLGNLFEIVNRTVLHKDTGMDEFG